ATVARVEEVVEELRDQYPSLVAVEDRPARKGDWAVVSFHGTRDDQPFENGSAERVPLILGEERLIPGFEDHVIGLRVGESTEFDITFPADYAEPSLAGQMAHFRVELRELRERVLPDLDDEFARSLGEYADVPALKADVRARLGRNALDRARHAFADRIIDYAVANSTLDLPDVLVDQETEVMHDEFRSSLARQGITEAAYLKATEKTEADLHRDFRPRAEERVKTLLVLSRIAEAEGVQVPDADVETEVARARERYSENPRLVRYFESERGRDFIRSTLRRSRTVERIIDDWLAAHPEHPALPHLEDDVSPVDAESVASAASIGATDLGSVTSHGGHEGAEASADKAAEGFAEPETDRQPEPAAERG
ncbi:MAG TPA: trigger factor, partial [Candidatus Dormibacteraeota bacterium]|nr:trigger factor [Candidatus Dormibacteraeota bacterium]